MPDANNDWQGWQAHYPSESWRLINRGRGNSGQSKPMRAPWYSSAESTLHFPQRVPRIRFLPTAPEGSISELMTGGRPDTLTARLVAPADSPAHKTAGKIGPTVEDALAACAWSWCDLAPNLNSAQLLFTAANGFCSVDAAGPQGTRLTPSLIREALLRFGWIASPDIIKEFKASRAALDGLTLVVTGTASIPGKTITTGTSVIPLRFVAFHHPLIEEVVGELEYAVSGGSLYRRYVVTPQPVQPGEAKDLSGFLALTASEKDPYGWAALQYLGLAATLKLYDRNLDAFAMPQELLRRIDTALSATAARYRAAFSNNVTGQPFVEVLLKPGSDGGF